MTTTENRPLADIIGEVLGPSVPIALSAYDGSRYGPPDAEVQLAVRSPKALSYLATAPGELGLARAYVAGELDLVGDPYRALALLEESRIKELRWAERLRVLRGLPKEVLRRVPPPVEEAPSRIRRTLHGLRHSKRRDADAISHHYDVSNRFYEWVLGPSMAYTCAVFPTERSSLEDAQYAKHDLVARKLALQPGMRLLDVGCGWGGMVRHAAREYGVKALGVTLSRRQAEWAAKRIAEEGLSELAEVRHGDYRDVREGGFDAVSSIGLTEHIGRAQLPAYFRFLHSRLRPQGRLLNHCITRPTTRERARTSGFIDRYVFPDGELSGVGTIVSVMQDNGFEVRHEENLREHYALTLAHWCANLSAHWAEAVEEVGQGKARIWALYMAGSRLGFEQRQIELHQVLGVRADGGASGMELRPVF